MKKTILTILTMMLMAVQGLSAQDASTTTDDGANGTYAETSVLATGSWAKIRVSETGITKLTSAVIKEAGFTDLSKVHIYGYGGNLIPDTLSQTYLKAHDDLKELPTYTANGVKYFYAEGPVSYTSDDAMVRTRNYFSDYGYYFITQNNNECLSCTEQDLYDKVQNSTAAHHFLYEKDEYAWAQTGRNLVQSTKITKDNPMTVNVIIPKGNTSAIIIPVISVGAATSFYISCGKKSTYGTTKLYDYYKCNFLTSLLSLSESDLSSFEKNEDGNTVCPVKISCETENVTMRLDYICANFHTPDSVTPIEKDESVYPTAEYFCNIMNQNHHGDDPADLIIIIPTKQQLLTQAQAFAKIHAEYDGMSTLIVPADELYNEFSSGTPDISAYKRFLKMFYDRAQATNSKMPKNVLLLGDAVWDNRMITLPSYDPDEYLLCHETENSYYTLDSFSSDDYITVLHDKQTIYETGANYDSGLKFDIGVGRIPVTTNSQAKIVVDKIEKYYKNVGSWQNNVFFFADDGDEGSHMRNINNVADSVIKQHPEFYTKKALADAYELSVTSTGSRYPDLASLIKKQQNDGALVMNYGGHASWTQLSDEMLVTLADAKSYTGDNYSLWFTAACETVPYDQTVETIGEQLLMNKNGGAIAFYGTTRTVDESKNAIMNKAFMRYVLTRDSLGKALSIGEAARQAKQSLVTNINSDGFEMSSNKHQYHVIGDPAMSLAVPRYEVVIDSINNKATTAVDTIEGNSIVTVKGHISSWKGEKTTSFNGTADLLVRDSQRKFECRNNLKEKTVMEYDDRTNILYHGTLDVTNGQFSGTFKMPSDIYNDKGTGRINVFAYDPTQKISANGYTDSFMAMGWQEVDNDSIGPSIYAYFNDQSFQNGGVVNMTPFFVAEVSDQDGLSTTGMALGHNMELIIDGSVSMTYDLNDNFTYDKGSYTSGQTYYVLSSLAAGEHTAKFTAWDILGNPNSTTLTFNVAKGVKPVVSSVRVYPNPVNSSATFYVTQDLKGDATIYLDIYDLSGRMVKTLYWTDTFSGTNSTSKKTWDAPYELARGMYVYRARVNCNGSEGVSPAQKLIIAQ